VSTAVGVGALSVRVDETITAGATTSTVTTHDDDRKAIRPLDSVNALPERQQAQRMACATLSTAEASAAIVCCSQGAAVTGSAAHRICTFAHPDTGTSTCSAVSSASIKLRAVCRRLLITPPLYSGRAELRSPERRIVRLHKLNRTVSGGNAPGNP